jgi:hypothetical protein
MRSEMGREHSYVARDADRLKVTIKRALGLVPQILKLSTAYDYGQITNILIDLRKDYEADDMVKKPESISAADELIRNYIINPIVKDPKGPPRAALSELADRFQRTLNYLDKQVDLVLGQNRDHFSFIHGKENLKNYDKRLAMSTRPLEDSDRGVV